MNTDKCVEKTGKEIETAGELGESKPGGLTDKSWGTKINSRWRKNDQTMKDNSYHSLPSQIPGEFSDWSTDHPVMSGNGNFNQITPGSFVNVTAMWPVWRCPDSVGGYKPRWQMFSPDCGLWIYFLLGSEMCGLEPAARIGKLCYLRLKQWASVWCYHREQSSCLWGWTHSESIKNSHTDCCRSQHYSHPHSHINDSRKWPYLGFKQINWREDGLRVTIEGKEGKLKQHFFFRRGIPKWKV